MHSISAHFRALMTVVLLSPILISSTPGSSQKRLDVDANLGLTLVSRYRSNLSSLLAGNCRSLPSCSQYSAECFENEPFPKAVLLSSDRLIRCGNDHSLPKVYVAGLQYAYDPLKFTISTSSNKPASDELLECLPISAIKTLRHLENLDDPQFSINYIHTLLNAEISRYCRDLLNVELSKTYRKTMRADAFIDSISSGHLRGQKKCTEELAHIILALGDFTQARDLALVADSSSKIAALCDFISADFGRPPSALLSYDMESNSSIEYLKTIKRNPSAAWMLGIIPGAGYLYCGQPESALSSLVLIGLFSGLAIEANKKDMPVLTSMSFLFGASFYLGSVTGPRRALYRKRDNLRQTLIKEQFQSLSNLNVH